MEQRKRALGLLLSQLKDGVLPWGSLHGACEQSLIITPEIDSQNNSCTNALKYSHVEFQQGLKEIPWRRCKTYHSTAKAMGVSLNTVQ